MPTVDLNPFSKEILSSKEDTVLLVDMSWADLQEQDLMVRLVLVSPVQDLTKPLMTLTVFLHKITRLTVKDGERTVAHMGPDDLNIHHTDVLFDDRAYAIAQRMSASWSFFRDTHNF
jgi:hypothetical protein